MPDIPRRSDLHLLLGWSAFKSRRSGSALGALAPDRFRALTQRILDEAK